MKDYAGVEIEVGDKVAYMETGYRNFSSGIVTKITEKKLAVGNTSRFPDTVIIIKKIVKE
jgi:hypothetical protein